MPKTVQIRDIDDDVYRSLSLRAASAGMSVPELLRREATRLARLPSVEQWLEGTRSRPSDISREEVVNSLDDLRGEWPNVGS